MGLVQISLSLCVCVRVIGCVHAVVLRAFHNPSFRQSEKGMVSSVRYGMTILRAFSSIKFPV